MSKTTRKGQEGTWITEEMIEAYCKLNELGIAKSVEVWQNDELVGGLYGIDLGHVFCGESMFSKVSNASKIAFIHLAKQLEKANYKLLDCQVYNEHLASLGCVEIDRENLLKYLDYNLVNYEKYSPCLFDIKPQYCLKPKFKLLWFLPIINQTGKINTKTNYNLFISTTLDSFNEK